MRYLCPFRLSSVFSLVVVGERKPGRPKQPILLQERGRSNRHKTAPMCHANCLHMPNQRPTNTIQDKLAHLVRLLCTAQKVLINIISLQLGATVAIRSVIKKSNFFLMFKRNIFLLPFCFHAFSFSSDNKVT